VIGNNSCGNISDKLQSLIIFFNDFCPLAFLTVLKSQ
jgi:hypothetical protein